jgi:glucokinase
MRPENRGVAVGIDIGGTTIKAGLVTAGGQMLHRRERPTPAKVPASEILNTIIEEGTELVSAAEHDGFELLGVGFGLASPCVGDEWVARNIFNIPALEGYELRPPLADAFGPNIAIDMDTHAATVGELHFGNLEPVSRLLLMCVGTGISCGIAVDGRLLRYASGTSGETGHVIVDPRILRRCPCGGRGCLESVASGPAIERSARAAFHSGSEEPHELLTLGQLAAAARAGNGAVLKVFEQAGRYLGIGLASLIHVFAPELILLGGGVTQAGDLLLGSLRAAIEEHTSPFFLETLTDVRVAGSGSNLGIIGAASLIIFGDRL